MTVESSTRGNTTVILNGRLEDWSVRDLLQIIRITGKTSALEIKTDDTSGILYFDEGALVDARSEQSTDTTDTLARIVETTFVLSMQASGSFAIGDASPSNPIDPVPVDTVLEMVDGHAEAEQGLRDVGLLDAAALRVGIPSVDRSVSPAAWSALASLVGEFTFETVCERIGRTGAVKVLRELRAVGLLEAAFEIDDEEEDEAAPEPQGSLDAVVAAAVTRVAEGEPPPRPESDGDPEPERKPPVGVTAPPDTKLVDVSDLGGRFRTSGS